MLLDFQNDSKTYADNVYLCEVYEADAMEVYFLICKTKIAPLKAGKLDALLSTLHLEL